MLNKTNQMLHHKQEWRHNAIPVFIFTEGRASKWHMKALYLILVKPSIF